MKTHTDNYKKNIGYSTHCHRTHLIFVFLTMMVVLTILQEVKQGVYAKGQAQVVAKNLKALISGGGKENKLGIYKAQPTMAIVSLGRKHGIAQFPFMTLSGRVPGFIKSGDLFVGQTRKDLGLQPK